MTERLRNTVALVTGASSGIGEATARTLAGDGAAVALLARGADRLEELARELHRSGATALVVEADVTDPRQVGAAVARTVAELGRIDTVVNSAGVILTGPVADAPAGSGTRCSRSISRGCCTSAGPPCHT